MSEELREKIARIIDPGVWVEYDRRSRLRHYFEQELQSALGGTFEEWRDVPPFCSLAKADSVLALIDHLEADGGVEDDLAAKSMMVDPKDTEEAARLLDRNEVLKDAVAELERDMRENVIPEIERDMRENALRVAETKHVPLFVSALPVLGVGR